MLSFLEFIGGYYAGLFILTPLILLIGVFTAANK
jgi:hypothetical protein